MATIANIQTIRSSEFILQTNFTSNQVNTVVFDAGPNSWYEIANISVISWPNIVLGTDNYIQIYNSASGQILMNRNFSFFGIPFDGGLKRDSFLIVPSGCLVRLSCNGVFGSPAAVRFIGQQFSNTP